MGATCFLLLHIGHIAVNVSHDQFGSETISISYQFRCFDEDYKH